MTKRKINIAIIGCGRISKSHIRAILEEKDRCNLIAICDESKENLDNTYKYTQDIFNENKIEINLSKFHDFKSLLKAHEKALIRIDLLVICTPSGLHSEQCIKASGYKINICTEKPMSLNIKDGEEMIRNCYKNKVSLFVVKQNRFNTTLIDLKSKVEKGYFGRIGLVSLNVFWHRPQSYYDQAEWRGTKKLDGGALMNQASHYVDLLEWIIGPVENLSANTATISRNIESEDTAVLNLKWKQGALGTMAITMITFPKNLEGSITIIGDKGSARIGGEALNKYEFFHFEEQIDLKETASSSYKLKNIYGSGHLPYYKNMIDSLLENKPAICDGESGLKSIKIISAAYKSSLSGKRVTL